MRSMGMWVCGISRSAATAWYLCNVRVTAGFLSWYSTVNRAFCGVRCAGVRWNRRRAGEHPHFVLPRFNEDSSFEIRQYAGEPQGSLSSAQRTLHEHSLEISLANDCLVQRAFIIIPSCDGASPMWPVVVSRRLEISTAPLRAMRLAP